MIKFMSYLNKTSDQKSGPWLEIKIFLLTSHLFVIEIIISSLKKDIFLVACIFYVFYQIT